MNDQVPQRNQALAHEVRGSGETVLYDETGNQLLVLNETGAAIWLLLDGERNVRDITNIIVEVLETPSDVVVAELDTFLEDLTSKGLITWQ